MSSKLKPFSARIHANCGLGAQNHHILRGIGGSAVCATSPWTPWRGGGVRDEPLDASADRRCARRALDALADRRCARRALDALADRRWPQSLRQSCLGGRGAWERGQLARRDNSLGEATADPLSAPVVERRKAGWSGERLASVSSTCERGSASTGSLRSDVGRREVRSNDSRVLPGAARTIDVLRGRSGTWWSKAVREAGIPRAAEPRGDHATESLRASPPRRGPETRATISRNGFQSSSSRSGFSMQSLMCTRKLTASAPSMMRWS